MIREKMVTIILVVLFGLLRCATTQEIAVAPVVSLPQYFGVPYSAVLPPMLSENQEVQFPYGNEEYPWQADLYEQPKIFAYKESLPYPPNPYEARRPQAILPPYLLEILGGKGSELPSWPEIWLAYLKLQKSTGTPHNSDLPKTTKNPTSENPLQAISNQSTSDPENKLTSSTPPSMDSTVQDSISSDDIGTATTFVSTNEASENTTEAENSTPYSSQSLEDDTTPGSTTIEPLTDVNPSLDIRSSTVVPLSTNTSVPSLTISYILQSLFDMYRERVPFINIVLSGPGNWSISFSQPSQKDISSDSASIVSPKAIPKIANDAVTDILALAKKLESKITNIFIQPSSASETSDGIGRPKNGLGDLISHATPSLQDYSTDNEQPTISPVLMSSQEGI
ncbi:uncharacterized protein [Palaemon carinicauda]|uniref:uncharacterized protein n=1 Tax=Palaemon carinicauda TaxID=392227 RepID=UPI0035B6727C